ncbi:MAG: adenine nucleotide alpha hydrolase family protein [Candidatus Aenigmarchaeota archaeon]|nr:adenine nucleotide alpha hydrolase family protein [Candidatus Aenigmarchaeota archaeon]
MVSDLLKSYKKKVFRTIKKYKLIVPGDKIYVALSGGKDSAAACYVLSRYVKEKEIDCDLVAFHITLGDFIPKEVREIVKKQATLCEVPLKIFSVSDFGIDMKKVSRLKRPICSNCGLIKRYLMNKIPKDKGANKLCTGHNADDFIVFFFKNLLGNHPEWTAKFLPLLPGSDGMLSRIRPLFFVGGEEDREFCESLGIPYLKEMPCPYLSIKRKMDKNRDKWFEIVENISRINPNFREQMMLGIMNVAEKFSSNLSVPNKCKICGEPTSGEICSFCKLKEKINNL